MRVRVLAVVSLLAYALLAAASPAAAQVPPSPGAAAVTVQFADESGKVSLDDGASFDATVTNAGQASGTPIDDQNRADVTLVVTGAPAGWNVAVAPSSIELGPGESAQVRVQVTLAAEAEADAAELILTATLTSPLEGLDPLLGPGGASQTATANDSLRVTRDDSVTRDILEAVGPWIYAILLLLVAAVLVAVGISVASRRALVRLASDARELPVPPGGRVVFPFKVEALAKQPDTVLLQVSAVQEGWAAFLPTPEMQMDPGQLEELTLVVIAPRGAADGTRQAVLVSATSAKAPKGAANLEFIAVVRSGTPVSAVRRVKGQ